MKTTERKSNITVQIIGAVIALALLALATFVLWWITGQAAEQLDTLRIWAMIATVAAPIAAVVGYRLGRIEAHGFLSGADRILDKMTGLVQEVSTIRDTSRITVHQATRPSGQVSAQSAPQVWGVATPQPPRLTYRTADADDVDSL